MRKTVVILSVIFISLASALAEESSTAMPASESAEVTATAGEIANTAAQSETAQAEDTSAEAIDTAAESEPAEPASASTEMTERAVSHAVVKGDTLWDISEKYYQNPWVWPKIWEANKLQISNPHWIYPEQVFIIPDKSALVPKQAELPQAENVQSPAQEAAPENVPEKVEEQKAEEPSVQEAEPAQEEAVEQAAAVETQEEEKEAEQAVAEPVPVEQEEPAVKEEQPPVLKKLDKSTKYYQEESFIAPEYWEGDGLIIGDKGKKLLISSGDTVFINLGSDKVKPGMSCMVYRKIGRFIDPSTRDFLGYEVHRVGRLEITDGVADQTATGKVVMSHVPIQIGDIVVIVRQK